MAATLWKFPLGGQAVNATVAQSVPTSNPKNDSAKVHVT
jgi:hypothetical protein